MGSKCPIVVVSSAYWIDHPLKYKFLATALFQYILPYNFAFPIQALCRMPIVGGTWELSYINPTLGKIKPVATCSPCSKMCLKMVAIMMAMVPVAELKQKTTAGVF